MQVLMFVSNPFISGPRVYAEAKSLIQSGYEVTVIARDREGRNPSRQIWDKIQIVRLRTRLAPKYGFVPWLWNGFNLLLWQHTCYFLGNKHTGSRCSRYDMPCASCRQAVERRPGVQVCSIKVIAVRPIVP